MSSTRPQAFAAWLVEGPRAVDFPFHQSTSFLLEKPRGRKRTSTGRRLWVMPEHCSTDSESITWVENRGTSRTRPAVIPVGPPNGNFKKPSAKALKACAVHLAAEIKHLNPKMIVAMGQYAIAACTGTPTSKVTIKQYGATVQPSIFTKEGRLAGCRQVYCMAHPAWALRDMHANLAVWRRQWEGLVRALKGETLELPGEWVYLKDKGEIEVFYRKMYSIYMKKGGGPPLAMDYEGTDVNPWKTKPLMVGYAMDGNSATVVDLAANDGWAIGFHVTLARLARDQVWHNAFYDRTCELAWGWPETKGFLWDTKCLAYLQNENLDMNLDHQTQLFLPELAGFKDKTEKDYDGPFSKMPREILAERCAYDCMATWRLHKVHAPGVDESYLYKHIVGAGYQDSVPHARPRLEGKPPLP